MTLNFDPVTQSRPEFYEFVRDDKKNRAFFAQKRIDKTSLGAVTTSATEDGEFVMRIDWQYVNRANVKFEMIGTNTTLPPVCTGYCKKTAMPALYGEQIDKNSWVAVITKLLGLDLRVVDIEDLFSLPMFEAIASGVAFATFDDDPIIQMTHPDLGTMAPLADNLLTKLKDLHIEPQKTDRHAPEAKLLPSLQDAAKLRPSPPAKPPPVALRTQAIHSAAGPPPWVVTRAIDMNRKEEVEHSYISTGPLEMKVQHKLWSEAVGAIYPLRPAVHILRDGALVDRIQIQQRPVGYREHKYVNNVSRYEAQL